MSETATRAGAEAALPSDAALRAALAAELAPLAERIDRDGLCGRAHPGRGQRA